MSSTRAGYSEAEIARLKDLGLSHFWQHTSQWSAIVESGGHDIVVSGDGCHYTNIEGRTFLDLVGALELVNIGYGRSEMADCAAAQVRQLPYWGAIRGATIPGIELAAKLAEITPGDLSHCFFVSDGSDAVESAVKMARQAQIQAGYPYRYKIVSRRNAYHGATPGCMSLEGPHAPINGALHWDPYNQPGGRQVHQMDCYRCPFQLQYPDCNLLCADAFEQMIEFEDPATVAAIIVDPVAIVPRCIVPPADYLPRLREICDRYGVLLIFDEVVNGFGRTGRWFAADHWGVVPDILCLSKGITSGYAPLACTIATDAVHDRFKGDFSNAFHHGHTWGGHPVACAVALKNIEIIERENLVANAADVGAYFLEGLQTLLRHPIVGNVQGLGLLLGIDLVTDKGSRRSLPPTSKEMRSIGQKLSEAGVACLFTFISPPLTISRQDVDFAVEALDRAIGETVREFGLG